MLHNVVEVIVTIYNTLLITNGPNFLDILLVQLTNEFLQCTNLHIEDVIVNDIPSNVDKSIHY
jgi:hypothetical protein